MSSNDRKIRIPIYQVDAFSDVPFKGNPAAVCIMPGEYDDSVLQAIAAEMNLSETAFLGRIEQKPLKESRNFTLRWFTPAVEVPLCGHATLATSAVLFDEIGLSSDEVTFRTLSGELIARRENGNKILLNFPSSETVEGDPPEEMMKAMGIACFQSTGYSRNGKTLLIQLEREESVKNLEPNFELLKKADQGGRDVRGVIVTSRSSPPYDFISRFFAPWVGINEDPVTGAAHTALTPYWSKILGKKEMSAYQASHRGGTLIVQMESDNRVNLIGRAVIVLKGELYL